MQNRKLLFLNLTLCYSFAQAGILDELSEFGQEARDSLYSYGIYQANQWCNWLSHPVAQYQVLGGGMLIVALYLVSHRRVLARYPQLAKKLQINLTPEELAAARHGGSEQ